MLYILSLVNKICLPPSNYLTDLYKCDSGMLHVAAQISSTTLGFINYLIHKMS